jgi:hypothetical protein
MNRAVRSKAEERFEALKKKDKQFLTDKMKAEKKISDRIETQRAARLARDAAEAEAAEAEAAVKEAEKAAKSAKKAKKPAAKKKSAAAASF